MVSHPIQYYAPLFRYAAQKFDLVVFYSHDPTDEETGRQGFGLKFKWDLNLLDGYESIFLRNRSASPDLAQFNGCNTPGVGNELRLHGITHVLIMGWYLRSYWQAFLYCIRNQLPVAVRGDSQVNPNEPPLKSLLKRALYPIFIRQYSRIFYVGKRNREYLMRHGANEAQLRFAPHAVDQEFWTASKATAGARSGKTVFLWVGKFISLKCPADAVNAFLLAYGSNREIELWMIGAGEVLDETTRLAQNHPAIRFLGFRNQTELRDLYSQGDCLILTSTSETWGLVVNEAFAMGLSAIVSDACGCVPDLIVENETGFAYNCGNVNQLAQKLLLVAAEMKQRGTAFKAFIAKKNRIYSYESNRAVLEDFVHGK